MPRILIIEIEPKLRRNLREGLTEEGFDFLTATDGHMSELQHQLGSPDRALDVPISDHPRHRDMRLSFRTTLIFVLILAGCRRLESESGNKGEEQESVSLPTLVVRLSHEAQQEAGLEVATVSRTSMSESLETTGWLQALPGTRWTIRAPTIGFFAPESESQILAVGQTVGKLQALGQLQAFVSPLDAVQLVLAKEEADMVIGQSTAALKIAEEQLSGLTENNATGAVAGTRLQQLRETIAQARVTIREAREKLPFLPDEPYEGSFHLKPVAINSPRGGTVTEVHVVPRQFVTQGDPLYTVVDWSSLWLKVPLFETDYHRVQAEEPAQVRLPGQDAGVSIDPVSVPAEIPPGGRTISRYYRIDNTTAELRPGQPLFVALRTGDEAQEFVIPRSSLLWDGFGNPWVYVRIDETTFRRTRVELGPAVGDAIVVRRGLDERAVVVTTGAQALFGEEFRGQIQAEDDD